MNVPVTRSAAPGRRAGAAVAGGARLGLRLLATLSLLAALLVYGAAPALAADPPAAPSVHTINRLHQGLTVYWYPPAANGGATITDYDVQYKLPAATEWTDVAHNGTALRATISGLSLGTSYAVRVRASNSAGAGEWSEVERESTRRDDGRPDPPELPTVTAADTQLTVSWTAPSYAGGPGRTIKGYEVLYRGPDGIARHWTPVGRRLITATSTTITGLDNGQTYEVWVGAVNSADQRGGFSPVEEGTPDESGGWCVLSGKVPPGRPSFNSVTPSSTSVRFRWDSVPSTTLVTDYMIYLAAADDWEDSWYRSPTLVTGHASAATPYDATVSGLAANTTYRAMLRVRTIVACYSGFSEIVTFTTDSDSPQRADPPGRLVRPVGADEPEQPTEQAEAQQEHERARAELVAQMRQWRNDPEWRTHKAHTDRWDRALLAFGETVADTSLTPMTAAEAQAFADRGWTRWVPVAEALRELEAG